jgi:hypothetical protein
MRERDPCVSRYIMGAEDWARALTWAWLRWIQPVGTAGKEPYKEKAVAVK